MAEGVFPHYYEGLSKNTYWLMGVMGALGLFMSIIIHELCHSLVAGKYGLPMKGITLFIFGGVAEMTDEPPSARAELMMAIAGPAASVAIGLGLFVILVLGKAMGWPKSMNAIISYLAYINILLAVFNLLPAFPLDGGRVLRAILWGWKNNLRWATRIASNIGSGFGALLIFLGVFQVIAGNFFGGIWWFLIGMFLKGAAESSYRQIIIRKALEGEKVKRFMNSHPITVPFSISIQDLIQDYIYRYHFKMFPVEKDGRLIGCVTLKQVKEIPERERENRLVGELTKGCSEGNTIGPEEDAIKALSAMNKTNSSRLMVVEDGKLIGIISLKDMMKLLSLKVDLV